MAAVMTGAREWKGEGEEDMTGWKWEREREEWESVVELTAWCEWAWEMRGTSGPSLAPRGYVWWLMHTRTYICGWRHRHTHTNNHSRWLFPLNNPTFNAWLQQMSIWATCLHFCLYEISKFKLYKTCLSFLAINLNSKNSSFICGLPLLVMLFTCQGGDAKIVLPKLHHQRAKSGQKLQWRVSSSCVCTHRHIHVPSCTHAHSPLYKPYYERHLHSSTRGDIVYNPQRDSVECIESGCIAGIQWLTLKSQPHIMFRKGNVMHWAPELFNHLHFNDHIMAH